MSNPIFQKNILEGNVFDRLSDLVDEHHEKLVALIEELRHAAVDQTPQHDCQVNATEILVATSGSQESEEPYKGERTKKDVESEESEEPYDNEIAKKVVESKTNEQTYDSERTKNDKETKGSFEYDSEKDNFFSSMRPKERVMTYNFSRATTLSKMSSKMRCQYLQRVTEATSFRTACTVVIVLNALSLGLFTEWRAQGKMTPDTESTFLWVETVFTFWYLGELIIRIGGNGPKFFYGSEKYLNWFDFILVLVDLNSYTSSAKVFRVARVFRSVKFFRVIRILRAMDELRMMLDSIVGSINAMLWVVLLLGIVTFMSAVLLMQNENARTCHWYEDKHCRWQSVPTSMISLISLVMGGEDWGPVFWSLYRSDPEYGVFFLGYLFFFNFLFINSVNALFVEALAQDKKANDFIVMEERLRNTREFKQMIKRLFEHLSKDQEGVSNISHKASMSVTKKILLEWIKHDDMKIFASRLGLHDVDLFRFVDIVTRGGKDTVDLDTFVYGCIKLSGSAKSVDLYEIGNDVKKCVANHNTHLREYREFRDDYNSFRRNCRDAFQNQVRTLEKLQHQLSKREAFSSSACQPTHVQL